MLRVAAVSVCAVLMVAVLQAEVAIQTVTVGNPGNAGELSGECVSNGYGPCHECGAVDYAYNIGTFEVTAGQYVEFLNAVAAEDTYGLYNTSMWSSDQGCKAQQDCSSGPCSYSVAPDWANRPVNYVSWGDAARFANWLHNGQPTGAQDLTTTENGSYYLNGATTYPELMAVVRKPNATWVIPSEDEWYKAAYHKNDGLTGNYWDYATGTDAVPNNGNPEGDTRNSANFDDGDYTIESPYWRTEAGAFALSGGPYGTFDQGGNVYEWNEAVLHGPDRVVRGGSFMDYSDDLHAAHRLGFIPTFENPYIGFRVARIPERGDYNANGTVNLADYAELPACLTGPEAGVEPQCGVFDFDFDVDVDLADFAGFQRVFRISTPEGMVFVPSGEFEMGNPWSEGDSDEQPVHTVYLSPYYIDRYEVTNQQYAAALNWAIAGEHIFVGADDQVVRGIHDNIRYCDTTASSSYSRITWDGSIFAVVSGKEDHPMVRVSWYGSVAYCNWRGAMEGKPPCYDLSTWTCDFGVAGYRLPTEAEWEKVSGWDPVQERHFRFGEHSDGCGYNCLDVRRANFFNSGHPFSFGEHHPPGTTPVGFYNGELHYREDFGWPGGQTSYQTQVAKSYYGCYDMSGNVWEWCNDWYDSGHYDSSRYSNPRGPGSGTERVLRGGGWLDVPSNCRSAYRDGKVPGYSFYSYGFRCALGTP